MTSYRVFPQVPYGFLQAFSCIFLNKFSPMHDSVGIFTTENEKTGDMKLLVVLEGTAEVFSCVLYKWSSNALDI